MSLLSDSSHPKQATLPKEDGLKNCDLDLDFSQLKLDEKGQCKDVVLRHCRKTKSNLKHS